VELARAGIPALRFDYDGTGDSSGSFLRGDGVDAWRASIRAALAELRRTGVPRIVTIGVRLGAVLMASVLADEPGADEPGGIAGAVLWDPCRRGRVFLREQRALLQVGNPALARRLDGSVETPGYVYDRAAVSVLERLELAPLVGAAGPPLLVLAPTLERRWLTDFGDRPFTDLEAVAGQKDMLAPDTSPHRVPAQTVRRIVDWASHHAGGPTVVLRPLPEVSEAVVGHAADGAPIRERVVSIGGDGLFGIETLPSSPSGTTVVFTNTSDIHRIGPGRTWVDYSRRLAALGVRSLRFDASGLGDSAGRERWSPGTPYAPTAIEDTAAAAQAEAASGVVVLVGLCSGGYAAAEAALVADVDLVLAINPAFHFRFPELADGRMDARRRLGYPRRAWLVRRSGSATGPARSGAGELDGHDGGGGRRRRPPLVAWWMADRLGVQPSPARAVLTLARRARRARLVCGEAEAGTIRTGRPLGLRKVLAEGRVTLEAIPDLDHALWDERSRETIWDIIAVEAVNAGGRDPHVGTDSSARPGDNPDQTSADSR
jgi:alpha/beta superfamily hydrolase